MATVKQFKAFVALALICCLIQSTVGSKPIVPPGRCAVESSAADIKDDTQQLLEDENQAKVKMTKVDPILVLLEEISRLKLDLMPYDSYPSNAAEPTLAKKRDIGKQIEESPSEAPQPSQPITETTDLNHPAFAQRSMGAATSGYRLFCCKRARNSSNSKKQQDFVPSVEKENDAKAETIAVTKSSDAEQSTEDSRTQRLQQLLDRLMKA